VEVSHFDKYVACVDVKEQVCSVENPNRKDKLLAVMLLKGYSITQNKISGKDSL